jgi:hypothetical protein
VETLLFFLIVLPDPTVCFLSKVILSKDGSLGTLAGVFFASGGLGYIFATVHHCVHWRFEEDIFNHRPIINELNKKQLVELDEKERTQLTPTNKVRMLTARETAESISLALWYSLLTDKHKLGTDAIDSLSSHAHALGTARIATVCAVVTTLGFSISHLTLSPYAYPIIIIPNILMPCLGIGIAWMFHDSYRRVALFAQKSYEMILDNECAKKKAENECAKKKASG